MHSSAMFYAKTFFETYAHGDLPEGFTIVEIGSQDVNGSLRDVAPAGARYIGLDFVAAKGVDIVIGDPYKMPLPDDYADVVVTSSCFEHSEFFWLTFNEVVRVVKPGGFIYLNAPSNGMFHRYPVDCWRFYPDSGEALAAWARRSGHDVSLIESFVGVRSDENIWNDFVAVFRKQPTLPQRVSELMLSRIAGYTNARTQSDVVGFVVDHTEFGYEYTEMVRLTQALAERDTQIAGLSEGVGERNAQITKLGQAVEERDARIAGLNDALGDRDTQITKLGNALAERDDRLEGLRQTLAEREHRILELGAALGEHAAEVEHLSRSVFEAESRVTVFGQAAAERDSLIAKLADNVADRDRRISDVGLALAERDKHSILLTGQLAERDARLENLLKTVAELESQIGSLGRHLIERDERITRLHGDVAARDSLLERTREALAARDSELARATDVLTERDSRITTLYQVAAERDRRVLALDEAVAKTERQLADLRQLLVQSDLRSAGVSQALEERDSQIENLTGVVTERNLKVASLGRELQARDERIEVLSHDLAEHARSSSEMGRAVSEHEGRIVQARDALMQHAEQIAILTDTVAERDARIERLSQAVSERDDLVRHLNLAVQARSRQIATQVEKLEAIVQSPSWRWTLPLRRLSERARTVFSRAKPAAAEPQHEVTAVSDAEIERVQLSPLFDRGFYTACYPDVREAPIDPATHYCLFGWKEQRDPSAAFSTRGYLDAHPDVAAAGVNPLVHYIEHGEAEGREIRPSSAAPVPLDVAGRDCEEQVTPESEVEPTSNVRADDEHLASEIEAIRDSGLFDADFYLSTYPDIQPSASDPTRHYCEHGWREGRNPSNAFDTVGYLNAYEDIKNAGLNPLWHYVVAGRAESRRPMPSARDRSSASERLAREAEDIRKSGMFDADYYLAMYPDIQPPPSDPLRHYCERGWREGRNPSDEFDTTGYLGAYHDIKAAALNPFWHYVVAGRRESRQAIPGANIRYEEDIYFGPLNCDVSLIAYYTTPDWSALQQPRSASKGAGQAVMPHEDLGFYDASACGLLARQASLARRHGVAAWCIPLSSDPSAGSGSSLSLLLSDPTVDIGLVADIDLRSSRPLDRHVALLETALADERYFRIDGRPVLVVSLPEDDRQCGEAIVAFNSVFAHTPDPYRIARRDGLGKRASEFCLQWGFDAVLDHPLTPIPWEAGDFKPFHRSGVDSVPYDVAVSQAIARMEADSEPRLACYRTVTLGRDNSALKPAVPLRYTNYQPRKLRRWLDAAIADARRKLPADRRVVFVNAWNDWCGGAVLEPDRAAGYSKLNETTRALLGMPTGLALPKVSVIVPNFNHARYLPRRLDSIFGQTYTNIEVLLLDDCSSDESREILSAYAGRFPAVARTLFNEKNSGGVFRQWAKGIKACTGDLVWIAESDDYCDEDFLEKLVRTFDDEAVMLAYAKTVFVESDESVSPTDFWQHVRYLECREKWERSYVNTAQREVSEALGVINTIPNASGAIFRRPLDMALLEDEAWLSSRAVGDWIFYLHQLRGGRIAYSVETTSYFRRYDSSTAAKSYKSEAFFRELMSAARTAQTLYSTPLSTVQQFVEAVRRHFDHHCRGTEQEFQALCSEAEIVESRGARTPNIAVSTMGFFPGGAEIFPLRMANELKKQGHSVVLLSTGHGEREDRVRRLLRRDIPVIETPYVDVTKQLLMDFNVEVLNSHQWHVQKYPAQVPDVFARLKAHVASLHGMIEYGDAFGVTSDQLRAANEYVTTWVYTADKNLGPFIEHGLYQPDSARFVKLPNGMEPPVIKPIRRAEIGIPDSAFVLCCVSRAIPDKGWAETIEAVSIARDMTGRDIRLILVGNGPLFDEYCSSGVPSFVFLAGFNENAVGFYAAADMGVMLTRFKSESFPLTIVDCLFAGKPFIATAVGEIRNMLTTGDGVAGEVIELCDWQIPVTQAASVIARFATDSEALGASVRLVPICVRRYRIDVVARQYVDIFERTVRACQHEPAAA